MSLIVVKKVQRMENTPKKQLITICKRPGKGDFVKMKIVSEMIMKCVPDKGKQLTS